MYSYSYQRRPFATPHNFIDTRARARTIQPTVLRSTLSFATDGVAQGMGVEDTAMRLAELSSEARGNEERYAVITAQNAAAGVDRERQRSRA